MGGNPVGVESHVNMLSSDFPWRVSERNKRVAVTEALLCDF